MALTAPVAFADRLGMSRLRRACEARLRQMRTARTRASLPLSRGQPKTSSESTFSCGQPQHKEFVHWLLPIATCSASSRTSRVCEEFDAHATVSLPSNFPQTMPLVSSPEAALARIRKGELAGSVESETLDFKQDHKDGEKATAGMVASEAICLANTRGGFVVLGVDDKGSGPNAFLGTKLDVAYVKQR